MSMVDAHMPIAIELSPLGARMRTFIHHVRTGGSELSDEDLAATWSETFPPFSFLRDLFSRWEGQTSAFIITKYEQAGPFAASAVLRGADSREWRACVAVDDQPPHAILASVVFPSPPGVFARDATASDGPAMRDIERHTPIVVGNTRTYYDRGDDYLAGERLMGDDVEMFVIERGGRVVGLGGRAFPPVRVAGVLHRGLYSHRLRLLPEAQGEGVQGPMNALRMLSGAARRCLSYAFIAEGNEAAIRSMPGRSPEAFWPSGASRIILDVATVAPATVGRMAEISDVDRLVALFNNAHDQEELFVPYTADSLAKRLSRAPDVYSWRDIMVGARAALGVWSASLGVRREAEGLVTNDVRALVLDYGCEPGAEAELLALIGAACTELAERGTTELSIFCSPASMTFAALTPLAKRVEPYKVRCAASPGPDLEMRGVHVDQLYF